MAGGEGTRIRKITKDKIPKSLVSLLGKPILEHQIEALRKNNVKQIYIVVGHMGLKISEHFKNGEDFGVSIQYICEETPLGSAGSLFFLKDSIYEDFLLLFGDVIFDINVDLMYNFHKDRNAIATLFVHPNSHPFDSDLVVVDENSKVLCFDSKNNNRNYYYSNCVNAGIYFFSPQVFTHFQELKKVDMERDLLFDICGEIGSVFAYLSSEYVKDVGTPDRLEKTAIHMKNGLVARRNLSNSQKCIFIDRDGTINKHIGLVTSPEQLELEMNVVEAIGLVNNSGYLAIVITNQPVVARGLCSVDTVNEIHKKLHTLLGNQHVYLDDILFCPHHPDKGYHEENPKYKIDCECRKPKVGMIKTAAAKYNIDLRQSWFIGDTTTDLLTGKNAGLMTALVKTGEAGGDGKYCLEPDYSAKNLLEAVKYILRI